MAAEDEVRQASDRFYAALNRMLNGDAGPLSEVWSHESDVTTMHPIGGRQVGWEQVRPIWEQVAHICSGGQVRLDDQLLRTSGDLAYEVGTERGQATMAGQTITGCTWPAFGGCSSPNGPVRWTPHGRSCWVISWKPTSR